MTGWGIHSVVGDQWYRFPTGYVLESGRWVRVHSGPDAKDHPPTDLKWSTRYLWNDKGDRGRLIDAEGKEVDTVSY